MNPQKIIEKTTTNHMATQTRTHSEHFGKIPCSEISFTRSDISGTKDNLGGYIERRPKKNEKE